LNSREIIEQCDPIRGIDIGSFAGFTIKNRLPMILERVIHENDFEAKTVQKLSELKDQISNGKVQDYIHNGEDASNWNKWIKSYIGFPWFELPFYGAEAYFYRLILDKTDYLHNYIDPFSVQKNQDILNKQNHFNKLLSKLLEIKQEASNEAIYIKYLLLNSLWGNKADLSQVHLDATIHEDINEDATIIDHIDYIVSIIQNGIKKIDIILDNCGLELFTDLILAVELIDTGLTERIILHSKAYPMFVSDATAFDIHSLIKYLVKRNDDPVSSYANNIISMIEGQKIIIKDHLFWNSPDYFYEMPNELFAELQSSDLIIIKGDANYRRVFGDRKIPMTELPVKFTTYLPTKSFAIRILKSEIMLGLDRQIIFSLNKSDKRWLSDGRYGIIQELN